MSSILKSLITRVTGLSDEEQEALDRDLERFSSDTPAVGDELESTLSGYADERFEIFLSADDLASTDFSSVEFAAAGATATDKKLMWFPIMREGQHAVRPGKFGQKVKRKLIVVAGKSKNQLKEIGLEDMKEAFDADAVENVTLPVAMGNMPAHANTELQNTGFIRKLKIADAKIIKGPNKGKTVKHLFGGYDFTRKGVKELVSEGTIAGRSAGLLYDYTSTETGKTWPVVLEHVALTNKPWIRGMKSFGRAIALSNDVEWAPMLLSEEDDTEFFEDEPELFADTASDASGDSSTIVWNKEESPNWLAQQVNTLLREARSEKFKARRELGVTMDYDDYPPRYRCVEAKPGTALVADDWGDDANFWAAPISTKDSEVEMEEFSKWTPLKKVYAKDDRPAPDKKDEPLDEPKIELSELEQARERRRQTLLGENPPAENDNNDTPRGGEQEVDDKDKNGATQLGEAADKRITDLEAQLAESEKQRKADAKEIARLAGRDALSETATFLSELRGHGIKEENGLGGVLKKVELYYQNADNDPVVGGTQFSDDGKEDVNLSLREVIKDIFDAFGEVKGIGEKLGTQLAEPTDVKLDEDGKPIADPANDGKPPLKPEGEGGEKLSNEQIAASFIADNPEIAKSLTGLKGVKIGEDGVLVMPGSKNGGGE